VISRELARKASGFLRQLKQRRRTTTRTTRTPTTRILIKDTMLVFSVVKLFSSSRKWLKCRASTYHTHDVVGARDIYLGAPAGKPCVCTSPEPQTSAPSR